MQTVVAVAVVMVRPMFSNARKVKTCFKLLVARAAVDILVGGSRI